MTPNQIRMALTIGALACLSPAVLAQESLTGMYRLGRDTTTIVGAEMATALDEFIGKNETLEWQVFVPENYSADRPAGLFVFIDPNGHGFMPDQWRAVFTEHNMIWAGVRRTQRRTSDVRQVWQAILGSRAIAQDYAIDLQRIYVGGSMDTVPLAVHTMLTANEISGAVYMRGSFDAGLLDAEFQQAMQRKYHVFITGTNDRNKAQVRYDYDKYQESGIENARLIFDMQRLDDMPKPEHMDEAFQYLDARLAR